MITQRINSLPAIALGLFAYTCIFNAWLCDDAFITFRTIDNFLHGFGLSWNSTERVQAYTHPLWLLLLIPFNALSGEIYYTSLIVSIAVSLAALTWVWLFARNPISALLAVSLLLLSKAYMDYTTSGLENPLSHFIIGAFVYLFVQRERLRLSAGGLAAVAALGVLCRSDLLLIFMPFLCWLLWRSPSRPTLLALAAGFAPWLLWEVFSLWYYGFPLPNTAYAKLLSLHIPRVELWRQGGFYYLNSLKTDPITLVIIFAAMLWVFWRGDRAWVRLLAVGMIFYLAYIVWIGGDFMSGRFFTVPYYGAVLILAQMPFQTSRRRWLLSLGAVWLLGLLSPDPPLLSDSTYGTNPNKLSDAHDIFDERAHYFQKTGLFALSPWDFSPQPVDRKPPPNFGQYIPIQPEVRVGMKGYKYGPYIHVVDCLALGDPLLARLPSLRPWKIAHFYRHLPNGYLHSLQSDSNQLTDPRLARYYDNIRLITRGHLWSIERLISIIRMNFGFYDHLINVSFYQQPPQKTVPLSKVNKTPDPYRNWYDPRNLHFPNTGLVIHLAERSSAKMIELSLDKFSDYNVRFYRGDELLGRSQIVTSLAPTAVSVWTVQVPADARQQRFDRIQIVPIQTNSRCTLGHLRIMRE